MNYINVLFIVDGSLSNPILFSQGIPHIRENTKKGIKYFVASFEDFDYLHNNPKIYENYLLAIKDLENNAEVITIPTSLHKRFNSFRIIVNGIFACIKIVQKKKINVIHGRSNLPSIIGLLVSLFYRVRLLYDIRGLVSDELTNKLRARIEKSFEKYLIKNADSIVVVSNAFKQFLIHHYHYSNLYKKINVIENSFSEERFTYSEELRITRRKKFHLDDKLVMVYSGLSVYWQRFDLVLQTYKSLKSLKNNVYLLVISYDPEIERVISESGINKEDYAVYNLAASQVNNYLAMGDFAILFRDNGNRSRVSAPIKLGEYLACGLPVLATPNIGDTESILCKYKTGIILDDEMKIKSRLLDIISLLENPEIRVNCRKTAEESFSLKRSAAKYFTIYQNMNDSLTKKK